MLAFALSVLSLIAYAVALGMGLFAVASLFAAGASIYSASLPHNLGIDDYYDPDGDDWNNE